MKKKSKAAEQLKKLRRGLRLNVKPPKAEVPVTVYSRKAKHRRGYDDSSVLITAATRDSAAGINSGMAR